MSSQAGWNLVEITSLQNRLTSGWNNIIKTAWKLVEITSLGWVQIPLEILTLAAVYHSPLFTLSHGLKNSGFLWAWTRELVSTIFLTKLPCFVFHEIVCSYSPFGPHDYNTSSPPSLLYFCVHLTYVVTFALYHPCEECGVQLGADQGHDGCRPRTHLHNLCDLVSP